MYTNNRDAYRQTFFTAWQKYQQKLPLEKVEAQLIEVILLHTEYRQVLENPATYQQQEFSLEENPFFHMSLHLTLREQIHTNRPKGISTLHQILLTQYQDIHAVEHSMMECLAQMMWKAQQTGMMTSDEEYLEKLKSLL